MNVRDSRVHNYPPRILGTGIGDNGHRGGSKSRLQHGAAWGAVTVIAQSPKRLPRA